MKKIRYMGPAASVNAVGVGRMLSGGVYEVEDGIAAELLASRRQRFELAAPETEPPRPKAAVRKAEA